jgi:hypothetical protein
MRMAAHVLVLLPDGAFEGTTEALRGSRNPRIVSFPLGVVLAKPGGPIGDDRVQVTSTDATLRGVQLTPDNMNKCVVNLVEA